MIAAYVLLGIIVSCLFLALSASGPATDRSRARVAARRGRFIEQNPTHVTSADILALLRGDRVSAPQACFITEKAAKQGIQPFTMWLWLKQFDAEALGIVVAADLSHTELLTHISNGTVPDLEELKLFASLNGLPLAGPRIPAKRSASAGSTKARQRTPMPPIFEPGTWPRSELASSRTVKKHTPRLGDRPGQGGLAA